MINRKTIGETLAMLKKKPRILKELIQSSGERMTSLLNDKQRFGLIYGSMGNLGDEAMAIAANQLLPDIKLMRYYHPKQERRLSHINLSGRHYFDGVILGGGTLICPTWAKEVRSALEQGLPLWSLGTGVGSSGFEQTNSVDIQDWKPLLADFVRIGVRGPSSKNLLESIGIKNSEIIGDLALSLTQNSSITPANPPRVAVNISVPSGQSYEEGDYEKIKELEPLLKELSTKGWQIVPIVMHPHDIPPLSKLIYRATGKEVSLSKITSTEQFFELVSPCTFTVAVRLHAAVLSCCVGVPPLMLGYRDKCMDFMQSMCLEDWHISLQNAQRLEISDKLMLLAETEVDFRSTLLNRSKKWQSKIQAYSSDIISRLY